MVISMCYRQILKVPSNGAEKSFLFFAVVFTAIPFCLIKVLTYSASFTSPKIGKNALSQRNDKKYFTYYPMDLF